MSQVQYNSYYKPQQQQQQVTLVQGQYASQLTPKRLPSMQAPAEQFQMTATPNNYTYNGQYESSQYTVELESPIKRATTPYSNATQSPVKLPSFKSLLQSIETPQTMNKNTTTLNFDTPLMNSLQLENSNYKPNPYFSSPLPPSEGTFQGAYNYSQLNFDQPQQQKSVLAPAAQITPSSSLSSTVSVNNVSAPVSRVESPLQYQAEKFSPMTMSTGPVSVPSQVVFKQQLLQLRKIIGGGIAAKPEKKFKCKLCSRGFNTAGNLSRHKKVHTGEKKYKCQYPGCESKFARSDSCMQHYKTHSNENGYTSRRFKKLGDGEICDEIQSL